MAEVASVEWPITSVKCQLAMEQGMMYATAVPLWEPAGLAELSCESHNL